MGRSFRGPARNFHSFSREYRVSSGMHCKIFMRSFLEQCWIGLWEASSPNFIFLRDNVGQVARAFLKKLCNLQDECRARQQGECQSKQRNFQGQSRVSQERSFQLHLHNFLEQYSAKNKRPDSHDCVVSTGNAGQAYGHVYTFLDSSIAWG